jgi:hypothetical protein
MTQSDGIRCWLSGVFSAKNRVPFALFTVSSVLAVVLGVNLRQHEADVSAGPLVYRSLQFQAIAPAGTVASAPAEFSWQSVPEAAAYRLSLMEVDRTEIWSVETTATTAPVPDHVREKMTAGTGFLWMVAAKNTAGEKIADTELQKLYISILNRSAR